MRTVQRYGKIWKIPEQEFTENLSACKSYAEFLRIYGLENKGGNWRSVVARIQSLGLSTEHFEKQTYAATRKNTVNSADIFCTNSVHSGLAAKRRILKHKLLPYECALCKISSWCGQKLTLQLDHINGDSKDHRLDNLRFLCPNCHSQTDTWGNKRR